MRLRRPSWPPGAVSTACAIPTVSRPGSTACWSTRAIAKRAAAEGGGASRSRSTRSRCRKHRDVRPGHDLADRDQLERGFRRLDVDQRTVLVMHYYLGFSLDEAAEALGVPAGTVRSGSIARSMRCAPPSRPMPDPQCSAKDGRHDVAKRFARRLRHAHAPVAGRGSPCRRARAPARARAGADGALAPTSSLGPPRMVVPRATHDAVAGGSATRSAPPAHRPPAGDGGRGRLDRLPAATAGSVRTGRERTGGVPVERPDLRCESGRLESGPVDVRRPIGGHSYVVTRRDPVRL